MKKGYLVLASGRIFQGSLFGADPSQSTTKQAEGEVVFNTSLTGYQEILTDPSYQGQIVVMTPSHIGNYGVNDEDFESKRVFLSGFVVQEVSTLPSNWRSQANLDDFLKKAGVMGLSGVDTRALTRHLRTLGAVNGLITTKSEKIEPTIEKAKQLPNLEGRDLVKEVTTKKSYDWTKSSGPWLNESIKTTGESAVPVTKRKIVVIDFGVKQNILRCLVDLNCDVTVVPAHTSASEILNHKPDGILLSNGPGDPASVEYGITTIKDLVEYNQIRKEKGEKGFAIFGICLGHQLLGLALGGTTYKLKFGHHGANHPIQDLETQRVDITTQNHGFGVAGSKNHKGQWEMNANPDVQVTHINLNDQAIEGLKHKTLPVFSVQYHPEASAGPHDARHLFQRFIQMMENKQN